MFMEFFTGHLTRCHLFCETFSGGIKWMGWEFLNSKQKSSEFWAKPRGSFKTGVQLSGFRDKGSRTPPDFHGNYSAIRPYFRKYNCIHNKTIVRFN